MTDATGSVGEEARHERGYGRVDAMQLGDVDGHDARDALRDALTSSTDTPWPKLARVETERRAQARLDRRQHERRVRVVGHLDGGAEDGSARRDSSSATSGISGSP